MRIINKLHLLLIAGLILTACQREEALVGPDKSQIYFSIQRLNGEIDESWDSRSISEETQVPIKQLHYVVLDGNNHIINPQWQTVAPDFSFVALEGLPDGSYSIAFFATTSDDTAVLKPIVKDDKLVLENPDNTAPLNIDYLFNRIDFTVNKENESREIAVQLKRNVGRVEVEITPTEPYSAYLIQKVEINIDSDSDIYQSCTSDGNGYAGSGTITMFDITKDRGFYSLPSKAPLSGTVTIESLRTNGEKIINNYRFGDMKIEAGKISRIKINWTSADSNKGFFRVRESDYTAENSEIMFLNSEPREVFYNSSLRSFRSNEPLQIRITSDKKLQVKSYIPIPLRNVMIMCRFKKYSNEFFPFAQYDVIKAFGNSWMYVPITEKKLTFTTQDGREVVIPAHPNLSGNDCEFKIVSDHPYMKKIATIKYPISISFSPFGADQGHPTWIHMTPALCRHACVLSVNYSFIFSSKEFEDKVEGWPASSSSAPGTANLLRDNNNVVMPAARVISSIRNRSVLLVGQVNSGGLGGGTTFGLQEGGFTRQYWDTDGLFTFNREAGFHEFGHCAGYNHSSSMTYGDAWTRLGQELVRELGSKGQLPMSNAKWETNYPEN